MECVVSFLYFCPCSLLGFRWLAWNQNFNQLLITCCHLLYLTNKMLMICIFRWMTILYIMFTVPCSCIFHMSLSLFWCLLVCSCLKTWQVDCLCSFPNWRYIQLSNKYIISFPSALVTVFLFVFPPYLVLSSFLLIDCLFVCLLFQLVQADLNSFLDAAEPNLRFLAMLAGPFYPILNLGKERHVPAYIFHCGSSTHALSQIQLSMILHGCYKWCLCNNL